MCLERVALVQACRAYRIGTLQACWTAECTQPAYNQRKGATALLPSIVLAGRPWP